jgi:ABC-2 type transport system permease protein
MKNIFILLTRELRSYFHTPIAYVFLIVFLFLSGLFTFYIGDFFTRGQADLIPFFSFLPWLYMIFVPAITMRTWAEERKSGTIELLFTLPITPFAAVVGKFLAAWLFIISALVLTFPMWICVNYLGHPDNGIILASYLGSILMAGSFLAIGVCISAFTKNQVIAFVITIVICMFFNITGFSLVLDGLANWLPARLIDTISSFSFLTNFEAITKGLIELPSVIYFSTIIICGLFANIIIIEIKKAE